MPDVAPPQDRHGPRLELPGTEAPNFVDLLSMQTRFGAPLFSGAGSAVTGGWMGLRERRPMDAAALAVLADAWYPAPWPRLRAWRPRPAWR